MFSSVCVCVRERDYEWERLYEIEGGKDCDDIISKGYGLTTYWLQRHKPIVKFWNIISRSTTPYVAIQTIT